MDITGISRLRVPTCGILSAYATLLTSAPTLKKLTCVRVRVRARVRVRVTYQLADVDKAHL